MDNLGHSEIIMFHIVLVQPEIPPNTGNIIRLCANTGIQLHLVKPLGFDMDDKQLRRAGLDYHEFAQVLVHDNWQAYMQAHGAQHRQFAFTTKGSKSAFECVFEPGDTWVFGRETAGLGTDLLQQFPPERRLRIPMRPDQRSLNLSNAAAIVAFEAWRQHGFVGSV